MNILCDWYNLVADYQLLSVKGTRSSTIEVRRVVYTVPSRLIGERLQVRLYHDHLALYVGQQQAEILPRVYPKPGQNRARSIKIVEYDVTQATTYDNSYY